jgi:8-oxo-dGTP pyrophosphatase MutT (NUDIX family)
MPQMVHDQPADQTRAALLADAQALADYLSDLLPRLPPWVTPPDARAATPRQAAVLVPLYARAGRPHFLFTRRSPALSAHSGEISFPGGAQDATDPTLTATALREAQEEIGLTPASVHVLGTLAPVFTVVSNFLITPVLGWLGAAPALLAPNPAEVAEVIEAPVADLADPAIFHAEQWLREGRPHPVYFYDLGPYRIWGATARILYQLLELLPA